MAENNAFNANKKKTFEVQVKTLANNRIVGGFLVSAAVSTFCRKNEDRHTFVIEPNEHRLVNSQLLENSSFGLPVMSLFAGVFDGHDGSEASDYCADGLICHVIDETKEQALSSAKLLTAPSSISPKSLSFNDVVEQSYVQAFEATERRFAGKRLAPSFDELVDTNDNIRFKKGFFERICCSPKRQIRGGTTATTFALYSDLSVSENESKSCFSPFPSVVIANTGDSRCITDDGSGKEVFRSVTFDHRPMMRNEAIRLKPYVRSGKAVISRESRFDCLRVHKGGLSVSRTIGDVGCSPAIICTPEVFVEKLDFNSSDLEVHQCHYSEKSYRYIIASDGLWDVLNTAEVGRIASRLQPLQHTVDEDNYTCTPANKEEQVKVQSVTSTSQRIIESCMQRGGEADDITIMVIDVSLA